MAKKKKRFLVDVHYDYLLSVEVEADNANEAESIVYGKIGLGKLKPTDAEPTFDYSVERPIELDDTDIHKSISKIISD